MTTGPGKGKKLCNECKSICNAPSKKCFRCGHEFVKVKEEQKAKAVAVKEENQKTRKVQSVPDGYENYTISSTIWVPAGECPIKLRVNPSKDELFEWADKVRVHFLKKNGMWLLNHALKYYLRFDESTYYSLPESKYEKICAVIDTIPDLSLKEVKSAPDL